MSGFTIKKSHAMLSSTVSHNQTPIPGSHRNRQTASWLLGKTWRDRRLGSQIHPRAVVEVVNVYVESSWSFLPAGAASETNGTNDSREGGPSPFTLFWSGIAGTQHQRIACAAGTIFRYHRQQFLAASAGSTSCYLQPCETRMAFNRRYLPHECAASASPQGRIEEVHRHLSLPVLEVEPRKRIPYVTVLPWNESIELQSPFIKSGDADIRISALKPQILSAKYETGHHVDTLPAGTHISMDYRAFR